MSEPTKKQRKKPGRKRRYAEPVEGRQLHMPPAFWAELEALDAPSLSLQFARALQSSAIVARLRKALTTGRTR